MNFSGSVPKVFAVFLILLRCGGEWYNCFEYIYFFISFLVDGIKCYECRVSDDISDFSKRGINECNDFDDDTPQTFCKGPNYCITGSMKLSHEDEVYSAVSHGCGRYIR